MKHLLLTLLLVTSAFTTALADSPDAILKDYRKQAAQAVERLNQSLEKAATPLITKLVSIGDTDGAELLTSQLKAKLAGEPVATPQASAVQLFKLYDEARAKALEPVQKSSISRIDSMLKIAGGAKIETITELSKVRSEIEAGKVVSYTNLAVEWSFRKSPTGGETGTVILNSNGTIQMKGGGDNSGKWKPLKDANTISVEWANPKDTWTVVFNETRDLAEIHSMVWKETRYLKAISTMHAK